MTNQKESSIPKPSDCSIIEEGQRGGKKYRPDKMAVYLECLGIVNDGTFFYQWNDKGYYAIMEEKDVGDIIQRQCVSLDYPITRQVEQDTIRTAEQLLNWDNVLKQKLTNAHCLVHGKGTLDNYEGKIVAFRNGWLNMDKPELKLLPPTTAFLVTSIDFFDVDFKFDLSIEEIEEYNTILSQFFMMDKTIDQFTQAVGYILFSRDMFPPYIFHFYGRGRTGKSLLSECIQNVLGYYSVQRVSLLSLSRQFGQFELKGKRLNLATETETSQQSNYTPIDAELLKKLAGGEEISAERKFKGQKKFRNTAKLLFCSNSPFLLGDNSSGMTRRVIHFPFKKEQDDNSDLKERMWSEEFKTILVSQQWFGWLEFCKNKQITLSEEMTEENKAMQNFDTWRAFLQERWVGMSDYAIRQAIERECPSCQELYDGYCDLCHKNGQKASSKHKFYEKFRQELSSKDGREVVITKRNSSGLFLDVERIL